LGLLTVTEFCCILGHVVLNDHRAYPLHNFSFSGLQLTKAFFRVNKHAIDTQPDFLRNAQEAILHYMKQWMYNGDHTHTGIHETYLTWLLSVDYANIDPAVEMKVLLKQLLIDHFWQSTERTVQIFNENVSLSEYVRAEARKQPDVSEFRSMIEMVGTTKGGRVEWLRVFMGCCEESAQHVSMIWKKMCDSMRANEGYMGMDYTLDHWAFLLWTSTTDTQCRFACEMVEHYIASAASAFRDASRFDDWSDLMNIKKHQRLPVEIIKSAGFIQAYSKQVLIKGALKSVSASLDGLPAKLIGGYTRCKF
jgi:hypothetical protein